MTAIISDCGTFRYQLHRRWSEANDKGLVLWVMLNPSTADAERDDPTIRRCIGFSKAWGYCGLMVGNVYALRSTDPKNLWKAADPIGPENDRHLNDMAARASLIMLAWGNNARPVRAAAVVHLLRQWSDVHCLGISNIRAPKHPLYIRGDTTPLHYGDRLPATVRDEP